MQTTWLDENFPSGVRVGLEVTEVDVDERSAFQQIQIVRTKAFGRALMLDGAWMTSEVDEPYYHELLVQPALCSAGPIGRVLIIGGGDGGSAREVARHPGVQRLVEIDGRVVELCRELMPSLSAGAYDDPRMELIIGDGVEYLRLAEPGSFDVILIDGTDPVGAAEALFGDEFYGSCARALSPEGVLALQSGSPLLMADTFAQTVALLQSHFPNVTPYLGVVPLYGVSHWSWIMASSSRDGRALDPQRSAAITATATVWNAELHQAAFALPTSLRASLRAPARG